MGTWASAGRITKTSGFFVKDEIKHLRTFKDASGKSFIFAAINDNKPKIFETG